MFVGYEQSNYINVLSTELPVKLESLFVLLLISLLLKYQILYIEK